jgi:hypothetical protein
MTITTITMSAPMITHFSRPFFFSFALSSPPQQSEQHQRAIPISAKSTVAIYAPRPERSAYWRIF